MKKITIYLNPFSTYSVRIWHGAQHYYLCYNNNSQRYFWGDEQAARHMLCTFKTGGDAAETLGTLKHNLHCLTIIDSKIMTDDNKVADASATFWLVYTNRPHADNPSKRHPTYESAFQEADRLVRKHPDNKFWVVKAVTEFVATTKIMNINLAH